MARPRKIILDVDPGPSDALAVCLALSAPDLELVAVTATGGNVGPRQASRNVQAIIEQVDPDRFPRIGMADDQQELLTDNRRLWGADGFCGVELKVAELHQQHPAVKLLADEVRSAPGDVTIIAGGPLTNLAALLQREPELAAKIGHLIIVGGTCGGAGDVTAAAEFNMYCNAEAADFVIHTPTTKTLLPLDATEGAMLTFDVLANLPSPETAMGRFLHAILPPAFQASRQKLGVEGFHAAEAVAVAVALHPELATSEPYHCEVETGGRLTHGATVIDRRRRPEHQANIDVVTELDAAAVIDCILRGLRAHA